MNPAPTTLPVAHSWFRTTAISDSITLINEPHVHELLRANMFHVRGRDSDLLIDAGLGITDLRPALPHLFDHEPVLVLTHTHLDHMGSAHEFTQCWAHSAETADHPRPGSLHGPTLAITLGIGDALPPLLISALPRANYNPDDYQLQPALVTKTLSDGDTIDLGDRSLTVLHLPGHSPGSIALFDDGDGTLFSGDVVYDDVLLDDIDGANIEAYRTSMQRLRRLQVSVVHPGHGASFNQARLHAIIEDYLTTRSAGTVPKTR